ncbi:MAG: hypothetical protein K1X57_08675, partial [Gemmataceae bacterium]|nr:hypothetical protein [Gemmataceae bacterium]
MLLPTSPTAEVIDHYLHGLLSEADHAQVERRVREEPAWSAALAAGRARLAALAAGLPAIEPAGELAPATVRHVFG